MYCKEFSLSLSCIYLSNYQQTFLFYSLKLIIFYPLSRTFFSTCSFFVLTKILQNRVDTYIYEKEVEIQKLFTLNNGHELDFENINSLIMSSPQILNLVCRLA